MRQDMEGVLAELPPRAIFPTAMPRYPNLWFLIDPALALRGQYTYAVRTLVAALERQIGLEDTFVRDVRNPALARLLSEPGEGSDFQARLWPLEPRRDPRDPSRSHGHQVHARFYVSPLVRSGWTRAAASWPGGRAEFFLVPASVHYEVSTEDPLHPYEDSCPMCGITGDYAVAVNPAGQDYCVKIHDPLGLEVLVHGTLRGSPALDAAGQAVRSLGHFEGSWSCRLEETRQPDGEPRVLARVMLFSR